MIRILIYIIIVVSSTSMIGQYTAIPDTEFEQFLIDEGIDSEGLLDGQILTSDGVGVIGLSPFTYDIADLTGLEAFVDLEVLQVTSGLITSVDLSQNPTITWLDLSRSPLIDIDLSPLTQLNVLNLSECKLSSIDLSSLGELTTIYLRENLLTSVDVSNNPNLLELSVSDNQISALNLEANQNLQQLVAENNLIETIDFTSNPSVWSIRVTGNNLSSIDLGQGESLIQLLVANNNLVSLDLDSSVNLLNLSAFQNQLEGVLDLSNNVLLRNIEVYENNIAEVKLPDSDQLEAVIIGTNPIDEILLPFSPNLWFLDTRETQISNFDLTQIPNVEVLTCGNSPLNQPMVFGEGTSLKVLSIENTMVTELDVSEAAELEYLNMRYDTPINFLDLSNNPNIEDILCFENSFIEQIDLRNGNNEIVNLSGAQCPNLTCIFVDDSSSGNGDFTIDPHTNLVNDEQECQELLSTSYLEDSYVGLTPNPVKDLLHITSPIEVQEAAVYDLSGRLVQEYAVVDKQINVSGLAAGVYLLRVEVEGSIFSHKLVKN